MEEKAGAAPAPAWAWNLGSALLGGAIGTFAGLLGVLKYIDTNYRSRAPTSGLKSGAEGIDILLVAATLIPAAVGAGALVGWFLVWILRRKCSNRAASEAPALRRRAPFWPWIVLATAFALAGPYVETALMFTNSVLPSPARALLDWSADPYRPWAEREARPEILTLVSWATLLDGLIPLAVGAAVVGISTTRRRVTSR